MSRLRSGFILGFHGCDAAVAEEILSGGSIRQSAKDFDWLGPGAYFWEADAQRALEWAQEKVVRGDYKHAAVVGAVVDLGNCLDLTTRADLELLADAYASFEQAQQKAGLAMPENRDARGASRDDKALRFLDCAVIKHLHQNIDDEAEDCRSRGEMPAISPFDTVRGLFAEGGQLYPGGGFYSHTHAQIAVRNEACIKGVFTPR